MFLGLEGCERGIGLLGMVMLIWLKCWVLMMVFFALLVRSLHGKAGKIKCRLFSSQCARKPPKGG